MSLQVGVVADTHVPSTYAKVPDELWRGLEGCEQVLHAGDFDSWETYEEFKKRFPTAAVIGNRDTFAICEEVPEHRVLDLSGFKIGMIHGFGPPKNLGPRVRQVWPGGPVDLLIYGHSHRPGVEEVDGIRMLNPGSPTDTLCAERQTFAILTLNDSLEIEIRDLAG
jgi:hypothetical protein